MWFERRMQAAGIDVVKLVRVCNIDAETMSFKSRYDFRPYLSSDFVSELDNCKSAAEWSGMAIHEDVSYGSAQYNSLFICTKARPLIIFKNFIQYIASGSPVITYHQFQQPLVELSDYVMQNRLATRIGALEVGETEQQILPGRSHPVMTDIVANGYILKMFAEKQPEGEVVKKGPLGKKKITKIRM